MKRTAPALVIALTAVSLTACGGSTTEAGSTASAAATAADSAIAGGTTPAATATTPVGGAATAGDCPTEATRTFAKTRFVADVGLAAGTFHRWIYTPYKDGKFAKGADGRTMALVKAAGIAALDLKLINNAYDNVQADPMLCTTLKAPLGKLKDSLNTMKGQITSGDLTSIAATESVLGTVLGSARQQGLKIDETTDESKAQ